MEFNKLVFGALALGCIVAAGAGTYLAVRQNTSAAPAAATPDSGNASASAPASQPVAASEGVITPAASDAPPAATSEPAPEPPAAAAEKPRKPARESAARASRPRESAARREAARQREERRAAIEPAPATPPPPTGSMWEPRPSVEPAVPERAPEPPPPPAIVEVVVPADAVLGLRVERTISSELARVEDRVDARVTRDVRVGDRIAIPAGATVQGSVTEVERGGKVREKARLAIRFHTVVLADGTRLAIRTEPVVREGRSPAGESTAKIGGAAAGGAILGAILGGGKGAAIGGAIGAAGGTAATMAGDRNPAVLPQGTTLSVRIQQPVTVSVSESEKE